MIRLENLTIRVATPADFETLSAHEDHIAPEVRRRCIEEGRIIIAEVNGEYAGQLRWNLFWDIVPFMNLIYFEEPYRGKGYGKALTEYWENAMRAAGHEKIMTSSAQDEFAQHFYVKLGYKAIGGFMITGDPLEIIFEKWFE